MFGIWILVGMVIVMEEGIVMSMLVLKVKHFLCFAGFMRSPFCSVAVLLGILNSKTPRQSLAA